jgi:hypothetical protein
LKEPRSFRVRPLTDLATGRASTRFLRPQQAQGAQQAQGRGPRARTPGGAGSPHQRRDGQSTPRQPADRPAHAAPPDTPRYLRASLDRRVGLRYSMTGMHQGETADYVAHTSSSPDDPTPLFSEDALALIDQASSRLSLTLPRSPSARPSSTSTRWPSPRQRPNDSGHGDSLTMTVPSSSNWSELTRSFIDSKLQETGRTGYSRPIARTTCAI